MTIASDSLTQHRNRSHHHHHHHHQTKESFIKRLRHLFTLALILLAPASAFAVSSTLNINISVTIAAVNDIQWTVASDPAGTPLTTGTRTWTLTGAAVNTAYETKNTNVLGPAGPALAVQTTSLHFTNKGNISINATIASANGTQWNIGAAPSTDVFMLEASIDSGSTYIATKVALTGTPLTLVNPQAYNANCALALMITTPTAVSATAKLTSVQVVTITAVQL